MLKVYQCIRVERMDYCFTVEDEARLVLAVFQEKEDAELFVRAKREEWGAMMATLDRNFTTHLDSVKPDVILEK